MCGVIDPLDETTTLQGRGKRVTIKGAGEEAPGDLIIGNELEGRENFHFVRVPGQKRVYTSKIDIDTSTKFEDWIEQDYSINRAVRPSRYARHRQLD